jgi:PAS domain S-box-containing protein
MATRKNTGKAVATGKTKSARPVSGVIAIGFAGKSFPALKQLLIPLLEHTGSSILITTALPAAINARLGDWLKTYRVRLRSVKDNTKAAPRTLYITPTGFRSSIIGDLIRLDGHVSREMEQQKKDQLASVLHDLNERIKEQTCLYEITKLAAAEPELESLLQWTANLIPPGWQYPEHTCCVIRYGKKEFRSTDFRKSSWHQSAERKTQDGNQLSITVYYKKKFPESDEGPFLKYERSLLNSIADSLLVYSSQVLVKTRSRQSELMLKEAQELALLGNWSYDLVQKKSYWSDSVYDIFGVPRHQVPQTFGAFFKQVIPADRKRVESIMRKARRTGGAFNLDYCIQTPKGGTKFIEEFGYSEKDDKGRVIRLFGTVQDISARLNAEQQLADSEHKYRSLFEASPLPGYICDISTLQLVDVNRRMTEQYGYTRDELRAMTIRDIHEEDQLQQLFQGLDKARRSNQVIHFGVLVHRHKDGKLKQVDANGKKIRIGDRDCIQIQAHDITDRMIQGNLDQLERQVIEQSLRSNVGIVVILKNYLMGLEKLITGLKASILRVSEGRVYNWASPSLPAFYGDALNGLAIGPSEGSCGTAAYTGKQVIVSSIATSPLWKKYSALAATAGLAACWSTPIFDPHGKVVATFANYYDEPREPSPIELEIFNRAAVLISILVESHEKEQTLRQSYERFEFVTKATSDAIWDWNLITDTTFCGDGFTDVIGEPLDQKDWKLSKWLEYTHPDDRSLITQKVEEVLRGKDSRWEQEYRIIRKGGQQAYVSDRAYIIRDKQGKPIRIIGAIRDITTKRAEEQQLKLLERVVTSTSDAVLITRTDMEGGKGHDQEIIFVNEAFTRMTGYLPQEVIGKTPAFLQGPKSDWSELSRLTLALKRGEPCSISTINYSKTGKEFRVEMTVQPIYDTSNRLTHFFSIQRDITEQFRQQQQSRFMEIVSTTFKAHESLSHSLSVVLKKLVEFGDFTAAETWLISPDKRVFNLAASFASTKEAKEYYKENKQLNSLTPEGGLLKEIWTKQELVIVDDFDKHPTLRRRAGVQKAGFKSALAIPLMNRGELIGALTVLTDRKADHLSEFEQLFKGLEEDLGSEIKRKQLENELSIIFNTAPDIIAVVGYDGYFKRLNPAASAILGYTTEELMSRPYNQFIHPDYVAPTDTITASLPTITEANYFENCYITKSGKPVLLGWTYQQIPDEDLVYTVAKDITRQKELQRLLHDATDLARIGAWEMDMATGQINWSDVTREIHEVPAGYQPVLDQVYQFYQESDKSILEKHVVRAINEGIPYDLELLHVTAKGNKRWVRVIGTPEMTNGKCTRIYGSFQDVHSRKLVEIELQQRTRYLSAIATVAQIFLSNEDWFDGVKNSFDLARYTMLADQIFYKEVYTDEATGEPMLRQRLGWVKGEDKPQIDQQVLPPMPLAMFPDIYEVLMADQHYAAVISDLPDGPLRQVLEPLGIRSVLFLPVFTGKKIEAVVGVEECGYERQWADGEIFFMRSLCSSLSSAIQRSRSNAAQKKLNEDLSRQTHELKISNAELEQFAYVASHDLQEPLRMITSFMTKLEDRYASQLDERARRYIDFAVDGASRMRQNILGLLQYSRVGKGDAMPEKIDLNEVMEEVCLLHQNDILESGAEIKVDPLPVVHNYLAPVVQLFNNLVSNALKYRKPDVPPLIQVSAKQEGEYWQIAIRDNGIGIDKEYLQKVFVIFQRLVPKEQYDGTGIGLAVVKKIVENLGGKVWVESTPGEGSTFYFTIRSVMN